MGKKRTFPWKLKKNWFLESNLVFCSVVLFPASASFLLLLYATSTPPQINYMGHGDFFYYRCSCLLRRCTNPIPTYSGSNSNSSCSLGGGDNSSTAAATQLGLVGREVVGGEEEGGSICHFCKSRSYVSAFRFCCRSAAQRPKREESQYCKKRSQF
jgi:hypothetical protein